MPPPVLALALALAASTPGAAVGEGILLRSGPADPTRVGAVAPDERVRLFQLAGPPTAGELAALRAVVERVYVYLPPHGFLVRTRSGGADLAAADLTAVGVVWSAPLLAEAKLAPEVAAAVGGDPRRRPLMVHVLPDADLPATVAAVEAALGRRVEAAAERARFSRIRLLLSDAELAALRAPIAELPGVFWLERESRKALSNETSIWVGQSGLAGGGTTPIFDRGILGAGQIVGVLDTGIDIDSCSFWDAANGLPAMNVCNGGTAVEPAQRKVIAVDFLWASECSSGGISAGEWDTQNHGTHVAGTVAGDDFAAPGVHNGWDGMAPQAKLVIQDCGYQVDDCADCPGIGCPVVDLVPIFQQAYDQGARIHTNSWGDEENDPARGQYTAGSEDADAMMWANPDFLLLFAAGNSGGLGANTVDSPSTAKSVLSVGATLRGALADSIASFSSRGPSDDGRIKPDLTFPGSSIRSAGNDDDVGTFNCAFRTSSGTSMASPGVAGLAALARQYYADGFYPGGVVEPLDGFGPSAALVKASLINGATPMLNEGTVPNTTQGWGRVLLDEVLYFPGDDRRLWIEDDPAGFAEGAAGEVRTFQLYVTDDAEPLELTLAWTDFPSTPAAAITLVNDLDLELDGPGGSFRGNVYSGGQSVAGGAADRRNTVEQILLPQPTLGTWTVTVRAFTVPEGPQPFALVATGAFVALEDLLFVDGFESGDVAAWSASVP